MCSGRLATTTEEHSHAAGYVLLANVNVSKEDFSTRNCAALKSTVREFIFDGCFVIADGQLHMSAPRTNDGGGFLEANQLATEDRLRISRAHE